jgi:hypothetical protein
MTNTLPQDPNAAQDWATRAKQIYSQLSSFGMVCLSADLSQNRVPRYADGMTLKDTVLLTGLPEQEAARRMAEHKRDGNPNLYAVLRLSMAAGKQYSPPAIIDAPAVPKPDEGVQLTFWGDESRAAPNAVFRSALFPALNPRQKENRRFLQNEDIYCPAGLKIIFTGQQFDQSDLDVYLELLNMAKPFPLGTPIRFSAYALLKALGLPVGGSNHAHLHAVLIRLRGGTPEIIDHGRRYFGGLIEGGFRDEITLEYEISINPKFAVFFGAGMFSTLDLETRRALGRNNAAKALHAYYSTHINPSAHNIETLANIAGLTNSNKRQLKATILKAHEALKKVGFLEDFKPTGENVLPIGINHSPSQTRAIAKQAAKAPRPRRRKAPTHVGDLIPGLLNPKK